MSNDLVVFLKKFCPYGNIQIFNHYDDLVFHSITWLIWTDFNSHVLFLPRYKYIYIIGISDEELKQVDAEVNND